jgi:hypothetical protein
VITGSLRVGGTLSVSTGTWIGTPASNTYQWQSSVNGTDWDSISGATNATFVVQAAQAGLYLRAQVFGNKTSAASVAYRITAATLSTAIIPALNIQNTAAPVVSGAWTQGTTISTTAGSWSATGTFTYQWQSSSDNSTWADISGATSSTYALTSNEASKFVRVQVVNTNASGAGIAFSAARSKVGAPFNTALPQRELGKTLQPHMVISGKSLPMEFLGSICRVKLQIPTFQPLTLQTFRFESM